MISRTAVYFHENLQKYISFDFSSEASRPSPLNGEAEKEANTSQ